MSSTISRFKITNEIRSILINDPDLYNLIGTKIYPLIAPEKTIGDTILYYRDQSFNEYCNEGVYSKKNNIFIVITSDDYEKSQDIVELVNNLIEGIHINENKQNFECRLIDSTEDYEDKKYLQLLLFQVDLN